jgi:hypothetical protein
MDPNRKTAPAHTSGYPLMTFDEGTAWIRLHELDERITERRRREEDERSERVERWRAR